jgi:phosphoglycolate phosphatase-like HAD superfamily hydrolase
LARAYNASGVGRNVRFSTEAGWVRATAPDYLIVFDKDGTLIDFDVMWAAFAEKHVQMVLDSESFRSEGDAKREEFRIAYNKAMDYDPISRSVGARGALACTPMHGIAEQTSSLIEMHVASPPAGFRETINALTMEALPDPIATCVPTTPALAPLFQRLQAMGCKLAICTTDDRAPTDITAKHLGISDMLIGTACGDDEGRAPKPSREQVDYLRELAGGIPAERTIMVGDTPTDMRLGRNSECILTVGRIGGSSLVEDLAPLADCMIGDLEQLPRLVELVMSQNK